MLSAASFSYAPKADFYKDFNHFSSKKLTLNGSNLHVEQMRPLKCYLFSLGYKIDSKIEFLYGKAYVPQNGV